jgi:putative nucleotidyltransferase with HDIG domain
MKRLGRYPATALRVAISIPRAVPRRRAALPAAPSTAHLIRAALLGVVLALCLTLALFLPPVISANRVDKGSVAPSTLLAPRDFSIVDETATAAARDRAASAVPLRFKSSVAAQQQALSLLTGLLDAVPGLQGLARDKGSFDKGVGTLTQLGQGTITPVLARELLGLTPTQLGSVRALTFDALTSAGQKEITPGQLAVARRAPSFASARPTALVRDIASQLFADFLEPNRLPDAAGTAQAGDAAAAAVPPVSVFYRHSQVIVRLGDVVSATQYAALKLVGLDDQEVSWSALAADLLISLVVVGLLHGYLVSIRSLILVRPRRILLLDTLFLGTTVASTFVLQGHGLLPFVFPTAMLSMLISILLDSDLSVVTTAVWAVLAGWYVGGSFEIATYYLVTGLTSALLVRSVRRSSDIFVAGFAASLVGMITILGFKLLNQGYDWLGLSTYVAGVLVSGGIAAALTIGSLSILGRVFGVTTALHLLELSHPNHPLLRRLMQEAPGTFHHSMMIGTLAERAAEQIGADPLLVRVVAYFHDIGKLVSPSSFAENQGGIANVHDQLEPKQSVEIILQHVYEGVRLARQYHLPEVLEDGVWQHHGTNLVSFFYQQAVAMYGQANTPIEDYRYPGPKPQSREMAILMLADGVEAAVRASPGIDGDQIRAITHRIAQDRLQDGQFDECNLTLRDLAVIQESFAIVLQGLSHPRLQYPAPVPAAVGG